MTATIGLVGLGLVGTAMAERLLAEGFDVIGFDIDSTKCKHLNKLGGKAVNSPAQVAELVSAEAEAVAGQTDRIVLSLPNTEVVLQVVEGTDGILESKKLPRYIIDTTTGDPEETAAMAKRHSIRTDR